MSNTVVGGVYQSIIEEVINTSRVDFEENGVEESVLDDLCQGWKRKLSQFNVAQFPWDPKPDPTDQSNAPPVTASAVSGPSGVLSSAGTGAKPDGSFPQPTMNPMGGPQGLSMPLAMPSMDQVAGKPDDMNSAVKMEPDLHNGSNMNGVPAMQHGGGPAMPNYSSMPMGGGPAAARAMQQLQNTFGPRAAASINAIHSGMHQNTTQQQARVMNAANAQQYRAQMASAQAHAAQAAHAAGQMHNSNGVGRSQMDGAGDAEDSGSQAAFFEGVLMQQQTAGQPPVELGRVEIDNLLHEQMTLRAKQMEGGGLMVPLREATKHSRKAAGSSQSQKGQKSQKSQRAGTIAQVDGMDDDENETKDGVIDEDAINSDLDDPDDNHEDDDDEDDVLGPIMLCVYDKVQRVKNKWKCTLKDGVLTVNGKEYVFHKATGEYEW